MVAVGGGHENIIEGEVTAVIYMGEALDCQVALGRERVRLRLNPSHTVAEGAKVKLAFHGHDCRVLSK